MKRLLTIAVSVIITFATVSAYSSDSISVENSPGKRQWVVLTSAGAGLAAAGSIANAVKGDWNAIAIGDEKNSVVDAVQYFPMAFPWVMKACGSQTRSGWGRMALSQGASVAIMASTVSLIKDNCASLRPDATDWRSFPSGHTAWAYMGAAFTARELSWRSPWYAFGAYSIASAVAMQRIVDKRHMPSDVMAGAGIGILASQLGYCIGDIIMGEKQFDKTNEPISTPNENPFAMSLINVFSIPVSDVCLSDYKIELLPALETSINLIMPVSAHWAVALMATAKSIPVFINSADSRTFVAPLNSAGLALIPKYRLPLNDVFSVTAEIGCKYYHNFSLKSINRSVKSDGNPIAGVANLGVELRLSDNLDFGAGLGYELKQYGFELLPDEVYRISEHMSVYKTIGSINLGIFTQVRF